jgi:hypothetical protein
MQQDLKNQSYSGITLQNYYFKIPIGQWDLYLKHIIGDIYGIEDGNYKIKHEYNGFRRIELRANPQIPLINSLPKTIHTNKCSIYYEGEILTDIIKSIEETISDYFMPGGKYHPNVKIININSEELEMIVHQLALKHVITKYAKLEYNKFIIYIEPYPITFILKVIDNTLVINIFTDNMISPFDIDDGYSGILESMNSIWEEWKNKSDITASIQPPNYI